MCTNQTYYRKAPKAVSCKNYVMTLFLKNPNVMIIMIIVPLRCTNFYIGYQMKDECHVIIFVVYAVYLRFV